MTNAHITKIVATLQNISATTPHHKIALPTNVLTAGYQGLLGTELTNIHMRLSCNFATTDVMARHRPDSGSTGKRRLQSQR